MSNLTAPSEEVQKKLDSTTLEARFKEHFPSASPEAIELLMGLLRYDPQKRILPQDGMRHAYCTQFHEEQPDQDLRASKYVGSKPSHAMENFLSENPHFEKDEKMMKLINNMTDNSKKSTQDYRELLHGICNAHERSSHR